MLVIVIMTIIVLVHILLIGTHIDVEGIVLILSVHAVEIVIIYETGRPRVARIMSFSGKLHS